MDENTIKKIAEQLNGMLSETIKSTIEDEVKKALKKSITDGEFFHAMTSDVQSSLDELMEEMTKLKQQMGISNDPDDNSPGLIFNYAADKLVDVYSKTEDATFLVIDRVEEQIELISKSKSNLSSMGKKELSSGLDKMNDNMFKILTALSFQDILGQQIEKIILFIKSTEKIISKLYVSQNMMLESRKENPKLPSDKLKKEIDEKITQENIDVLLSQYGIE